MKRRRSIIFAAAAVMTAFGAAGSACRAPTQINVVVTAPDDEVCQARLETEISVGTIGAYESRAPSSTAAGCTSHRIGELVVIPTDDESEDIALRVVGSLDGSKCEAPAYGPSCIVARRALHFIPHESLTVIVELGAACENIPCSSTTTCVDKACVGATIGDPSQCATAAGCDEGALGPRAEAGAPEASPPDAGVVDAHLEASALDATTDAGDALGPLVTVGDDFVCARRASGIVACWGRNASGELGFFPSDGGREPLPKDVPALGTPAALAGGDHYACELLPSGVVKCWGDNAGGVLGLPVDAGISPPTTLASSASGLCAGSYTSCVIDANGGTVRCWQGNNDDGQPVVGVSNAAQLACGAQVQCARINDGTVRCWGGSDVGDLGVPGVTGTSSGVQPAITGVVDLAMYFHHVCAALADGGVECWGLNGDRESDPSYDAGGDADLPNVQTPTIVRGVSGATHVAVGLYHSCALLTDGGVTCWGNNSASQLGTSSGCGEGCGPSPVPLVPHALQIASGLNETCAVIDDGGVWCWGADGEGQLGRGTILGDDVPAPARL